VVAGAAAEVVAAALAEVGNSKKITSFKLYLKYR